VIRSNATKTTLKAPLLAGDEPNLFVKLYHFDEWRGYGLALLRRIGGRHDMRVARRLLEIGVPTPQPIAARSRRMHPLRPARILYAAKWIEGSQTFDEALRGAETGSGSASSLIEAGGRFVGFLHEKGVSPRDMNPSNLLLRKKADGSPEFFLIDYERMRLSRSVSYDVRVRNLAQVGVNLGPIAENYEELLCRGYSQVCLGVDIVAMARDVSRQTLKFRESNRVALEKRFKKIGNAREKEKREKEKRAKAKAAPTAD
jgi:tRNA A-37 threonylcarbamoyl transferase component Bud32